MRYLRAGWALPLLAHCAVRRRERRIKGFKITVLESRNISLSNRYTIVLHRFLYGRPDPLA